MVATRRQAAVRGLASNPATPDDLAIRLIQDPGLVYAVVRTRPRVSERFVDAVLKLGADGARWLGGNESTPQGILLRLSEHPSAEVHASTADRIIDEGVLIRLAADPASEVRKTLAERWHNPPPEVLRAWLTDEDGDIRYAALHWSAVPPPPDLLDALLADPVTSADALRHADLTPELITRFSESDDAEENLRLANHPALPSGTVRSLAAAENEMFMVGLLLNQVTPDDVRAALLAKVPALHPIREWTVDYFLSNLSRNVREVQWLREMPLAGRLEYLDSPYEFFRTVVAGSRELPQWALDRLMTDESTMVRRVTAADHDSVSGAALEELFLSHGESRAFGRLLTEHPCFPRDAFLRFAHSGDSGLRAIACSCPDLPAPLVAEIATDPVAGTREAAARHPNVPFPTVRRLLADEDPGVVSAAASSPALPVADMYAIFDA
ncbi:hypothetical protein [Amycolatopsis sp. DG1A-15b]|uniref:hypothetical protein n=1 Tax=Amycolatopsis sp. DG1A-15b TaxID=3052846 RepID=UPI00255BFB15|nr:hypothetical protein [Amycolatopsis sp. DG1A-15b]WIX84336.1 hypothetical protein QRY02_24045 [Amycolatopsis sp. DG1A-15b]